MARVPGRRSTEKETAWLRRFEDWSHSGLSGKAYCHQHGLSGSTFRWWKRELSRRGKWPVAVEPQRRCLPGRACEPTHLPFLPITVVSTSRPTLILSVSERYRVEIPRGFDSESLERVLAILEQRTC